MARDANAIDAGEHHRKYTKRLAAEAPRLRNFF
jgi:hypothetical protein